MKTNGYHRWILAGFMGLGLSAALPALADERDAAERTRVRARDAARQDDVEEVVPYDQLPERVKQTVDEQRSGRKIVSCHLVRREGRDVYRVGVEMRNGERSIRVSPRGSLLSVEDVREADLAAYRENPAKWSRTFEERQAARESYYAREAERVTATVANPERVDWDRLPARVRTTLARESGGDKLDNVARYREKDNIIYQSNIPEGRGKVHMVQVLPDGTIYNEGAFNEGGQKIDADWRPRTLGYEDLPRRVREVIDREAPNGRVPHVEVATRRGHKVYTVEVDRNDDTRYLTINEDGKVISDITERLDDRALDNRR